MLVLALSGVSAAASIALMSTNTAAGIVCAILSYIGIGIGAGAAGTSLLVLIAKITSPARKPTAAALVWTMMIAGTALAASLGGRMLDPFSMARLVSVSGSISAICFTFAVFAIWGSSAAIFKPRRAPGSSRTPSFRLCGRFGRSPRRGA